MDDEEYEGVCIPSHNEHPSQNIRVLRVTGGTHTPHMIPSVTSSVVFDGTFAQLFIIVDNEDGWIPSNQKHPSQNIRM